MATESSKEITLGGPNATAIFKKHHIVYDNEIPDNAERLTADEYIDKLFKDVESDIQST